MNYFEHHIGDYAAATAHLSWDEDMAYTRLIRAYYQHQRPIPLERPAVYRLARATSAAQKAAVDTVLSEFFILSDDGWHQQRCDEEITAYLEKQSGAGERREHEAERKRLYRERRAELFADLRAVGIVPAYDTPTPELVRMLSRGTGASPAVGQDGDGTATHTQSQSQTHSLKAKGRSAPLALPDWLSPDDWKLWHDFRNARRGWTTKARELSLRTLGTLRADGHDPKAVIEQSIERGWTGLFPVRAPQSRTSTPGLAPSRQFQALAGVQAMIEECQRDESGISDGPRLVHDGDC